MTTPFLGTAHTMASAPLRAALVASLTERAEAFEKVEGRPVGSATTVTFHRPYHPPRVFLCRVALREPGGEGGVSGGPVDAAERIVRTASPDTLAASDRVIVYGPEVEPEDVAGHDPVRRPLWAMVLDVNGQPGPTSSTITRQTPATVLHVVEWPGELDEAAWVRRDGAAMDAVGTG